MRRCIEQAHEAAAAGGYALGAVVANREDLLACVGSILTQKTDPTAHPEMEAIKQAARIKDSRYLEGCYLFSTLEPCPMCCAAAVWAKMAGVVFGASQQDALAWTAAHPGIKHSWWQIEIPAHLIAQAGDPALAIWEGVLRAQYQELFNLSEKASPERR